MTDTQKTINTMKQQPILSGVFAVILVLMLGVAAGYAAGFDAPARAYAQLVAPVVVTAPVVAPVITPPVIAPVIAPVVVPVIAPVVTAPTTVAGVTVTGSASTDSNTQVGGTGQDTLVSGVTVVAQNPTGDTDTHTSPCCTQQTTDTGTNTVAPVTVVAALPTVDQDTHTSPCCTVPVTTPSVPVVTTPVENPPVVTPPVVTPPENPPVIVPECTFLTASATDIAPGQAVTLSWKTVNATGISIDNGVGSVSPVAAGSTVVHPTSDTTYTATVTGANGSVHCSAPVRIRTVTSSVECVAFTASVTDINPGDAVTLAWQTRNATGISIDNGIGPVTPVASGTIVVRPTQDTTYVATVTGASGTVHCSAPVHMRTVQTLPKCVAFTGTPYEINPGDAVTLAWQTENATSITIDQGVGSVTPVDAGSTVVHPTANTTYTATVANASGSVQCAAPVKIKPGTSNGGKCVQLTASAQTINPGDTVTLTWATSNATSVSIDQGVGTVTPTAGGSVDVNPTSSITYTAQVPGESIQTACQVHIDVSTTGCTSGCGGGGGSNHHGSHHSSKPDVLLSATGQPLASVYLSQIPYTGLDLGPIGTALYWIMLVLWSLAAAYLILFGALPYALRRAKGFGSNVSEALNREPAASAAPEASISAAQPESSYAAFAASLFPAQSAPTPHFAPVMETAAPVQSTLAREGFKSFASGDALTIDDIVKGLSRESGMVFSQHVEAEAAPVMEVAPVEPVAPVAPVQMQAAPAPAPVIAYSDDVSSFLGALLTGDRETVFGTLRSVNRAGGDAQEFLAHAVCALDDAYRARTDGTPCHPEIARITNDCATSFLERMVSSLATAIDSSYSAGITGAKLAVTRALSIVNG